MTTTTPTPLLTGDRPAVFRDAGENFMTPAIIGYCKISETRWAELSHGTGIEHETIYGVSVRPEADAWKHEPYDYDAKLSDLFHSRRQADAHLAALCERTDV